MSRPTSLLLKDHTALLFAWLEERATEHAQIGADCTAPVSHRQTAENALMANRDAWIALAEQCKESQRAVETIGESVHDLDDAFFDVCHDTLTGRDDKESGQALGEAMAALGADIDFLCDAPVPREKFRALAALIHATVKARKEALDSPTDASLLRKYVSTRSSVFASAGGL